MISCNPSRFFEKAIISALTITTKYCSVVNNVLTFKYTSLLTKKSKITRTILTNAPCVIIVLNKVDKLKDPIKKEQNILTYKMLFDTNLPTARISAQTGRNIDTLISTIMRKLPQGAPIYDEDDLTDESMRSIAQEIIREKMLLNTKDEIPHSVAVIIEKYEEKDDIDRISAVIHVEHESQKGIMIGKKGQMLKKIGTQARIELEKMLDKRVFLELNVKVSKDWRKKTPDLENWV